MKNLYNTEPDVVYDGLITNVMPPVLVGGGTIRKGSAEATYVRGTILAVSSGSAGDGKLVILGTTAETNETLTPYGILCDDVVVGTAADEKVTVYTGGCFDPAKVTVKTSYTITAADIDALRCRNIVFKAAQAN